MGRGSFRILINFQWGYFENLLTAHFLSASRAPEASRELSPATCVNLCCMSFARVMCRYFLTRSSLCVSAGTAWAPDEDDDDGNMTPPAERTRPSVGTLQLFYNTPPNSVSTRSIIYTSGTVLQHTHAARPPCLTTRPAQRLHCLRSTSGRSNQPTQLDECMSIQTIPFYPELCN